MALSAVSCAAGESSSSNTSSDGGTAAEYLVGSTLKKTSGGRMYLEVEGEPFLYTGVQIRADGYTQLDNRSLAEMEEQFRLASELGVKCVEVPISWNELEPEEDVYNFRKFKTYLEWCLKYDLKLEVLWFSYSTGQSLEMYVPSYIFDDEETYPQYPSDVKGQVWGEQGRITFFQMSDRTLLSRERKAIEQLTDFLYEWENANGNPNVVIAYQVHNEVDNFPRWNIDSRNVLTPDGSEKLPRETAWQDIYTSLDSAGRAFKESKYRAVTRTNLVALRNSGDEWKDFAVKIFELEGIDIVGDDTYTSSVSEQTYSMDNLGGEEFGYENLPHVAENSGSFANSPTLVLSAVTQGAGYLMYCLSMPMFWIRYETNWDWWEQGVLTVDWEDKTHTQAVRDIFTGLKKAAVPLAGCEKTDMFAFNAITDTPETEKQETFTLLNTQVTLKTSSGALGYLLQYEGSMYVFTDKEAELYLENATISEVTYGSFSGADFVVESSAEYSANKVNLSGNCLYKIKL